MFFFEFIFFGVPECEVFVGDQNFVVGRVCDGASRDFAVFDHFAIKMKKPNHKRHFRMVKGAFGNKL